MKEIDLACNIMSKMDHLQELLGLREYNDVDEPLEVTVSTQLLDLVMFEIRDVLASTHGPELMKMLEGKDGR